MKIFQKLAIVIVALMLSAVGASAQCTAVPNTSSYTINPTATPGTSTTNPWSISGSGLGVEPLVYLQKTTWVSNGLSLGYSAATQTTGTVGENFVHTAELLSFGGGTTPTTGIYFDSNLGYVEVLVSPTPSQSGQYSIQIALYHRPYIQNYNGPAGYQLVSVNGPTNLTLPVYIRMTKSGLSFTGATSTDGVNYTSFGSAAYTQGTFANFSDVGLVAYSGDNILNSVAAANFQNDSISDNDTGNVSSPESLIDANYGTAATNGNTGLEFGQPTAPVTADFSISGNTTFSFTGCTPQQQASLVSEINSSTVRIQVVVDADLSAATELSSVVENNPVSTSPLNGTAPGDASINFANLVGLNSNFAPSAQFQAVNSSGVAWLQWSWILSNFIFGMEEAYTLGRVTLVSGSIYSQIPYCTPATTPPDFDPETFVVSGTGPYPYALGASVCVSTNIFTPGWHCTPGPAVGIRFTPFQRFSCTKNTPPY